MKRYVAIISTILVFSIGLSAQTHSFEVHTGLESSVDISKRLSLGVEAETRFQQYSATLKRVSFGVDAKYNITKPLRVALGYEISERYKKNGYFEFHTISGTVAYRFKFNEVRLDIQTKMCFYKNTYIKNPEDIRPTFVDKNKAKLSYTAWQRVRPSAYVEVYHPIQAGNSYIVSTMKVGVNCDFTFRKNIGASVGYTFRHDFDENAYISIVGLSVSKSF